MSGSKIRYRLALAILAPLLALAALEGLLALTGRFEPHRLLVPVDEGGQRFYAANPEYGRRFLPRWNIPMPSPLWVRAEKPPGVKRVLLLGESAAAGFPHPEFNLARCLEQVWAFYHPHQQIEVINLTMVAVNFHILRLFADEAWKLNPDAVILYAGHNEAIGPYGPASVLGRATSSRRVIQANLWVRNTRIGRAMEAVREKASGGRTRARARWGGLDEFGEVRIPNDHPRLNTMAEHTRENVRDVLRGAMRRGIPALVCLPGVNLTDWPPLESAPEAMDDTTALAAWRRGDARQMTSAWQAYRLASQHADFGDWETAWPLYRRAVDLDLHRFRADTRVREALTLAARDFAGPRVLLMDVDRRLHEENPLFVTDREYFCEHVHLTLAGRLAVAAMCAEGLQALWGETRAWAGADLTIQDMARRLLFTPMDEMVLWQSVRDLLTLGVFATQPDAEERQAMILNTLEQIHALSRQQWNIERMEEAYRAASAVAPNDVMLDVIAGRHFRDYGDQARAVDALRKGLSRFPSYPHGQLLLAQALMAVGEMDEAGSALAAAARHGFEMPMLFVIRGEWHARQGRLNEARVDLERAREAAPGHYGAMVNLANVYLLLGEDALAMSAFADCLEVDSGDAGVLNNYAWLLATSPRAGPEQHREALILIDRAMQARPGFRRYEATRALALAANGRAMEAREVGRAAAAYLEQNGDIKTAREFRDRLAQRGVTW
ncbi:MAG TPA: tetratricopeptide repeat protein [Kiritimatiellia bacterium]|nr:tetratricopeptide repeat protein [Kiritimatiellia bacterium]HMO99166.1 tetratricopeptide repeat protein [Kiritimatiellia bacterium]